MSQVTELEGQIQDSRVHAPCSHTLLEPTPLASVSCASLGAGRIQEPEFSCKISTASGPQSGPRASWFFLFFSFLWLYYTGIGHFSISTTQTFLNSSGPGSGRDKEIDGGRREWNRKGGTCRNEHICLLLACSPLSLLLFFSSLLQPAQGSTPWLPSGPDQHPAWRLHPLWVQRRLPLGGTQHGHLYPAPPRLLPVE